jgi:hypothetical protein
MREQLMKRRRIWRIEIWCLLLCALFLVPSISAVGPSFTPSSFEELVHDSTDIVIGKVKATSKEGEGFQFKRKIIVSVAKALKGDLSDKEIVIYHDVFYPSVDVSVTEGKSYVLFLHRDGKADFFTYLRHDWACWEILADQIVNRQELRHQVTPIQMAGFLAAIASEMRRVAKPLAKSFAGIQMGDSLRHASQSTGLTFLKYNLATSDVADWERYYALLPNSRQEHLITLSLYKGKILDLDIYFLKGCAGCPKFLRQMELMSGGTPLSQFGDLSFSLGRLWSDRNVSVRLGEITFGKANGYPWGEFRAYQVSITDQHVFGEYLKDRKHQLTVK